MSTRCHIIVEDKEFDTTTILYRHHDGYPDGCNGMLATLVPFVQRFMKNRGWDACYLGAQILYDQIKQSRESSREYCLQNIAQDKAAGREPSKYMQERLDNLDNDFLGFGISSDIHGDVNYIYRVTQDGITVEEASGEVLTTPEEAAAMLKGVIPERYR